MKKRLISVILLLAMILPACTGAGVECTIEFFVDGQVYHSVQTKTNGIIDMPDQPTKDGYVFEGWYYDDGVWQKPFTAASLSEQRLSKDMKISLYAHFVEDTQDPEDDDGDDDIGDQPTDDGNDFNSGLNVSVGGEDMKYITVTKLEDAKTKIIDVKSAGFASMLTTMDDKDVAYWHAKSSKSVDFDSEIDISDYDTLCFSVYSEQATDSVVQLRLNCPSELQGSNAMAPYFRFSISINFEGWKDFSISISDMSGNYNPTTTRLTSLSFDCSGWSLTANPNNKLYFTDIMGAKTQRKIWVPQGVDINDVSIYKTVTNNYRETLVGFEQGSDSVEYNTIIKSLAKNCGKIWKTNSKSFKNTYVGMTRDTLFGYVVGRDSTYNVDENKITVMYENLQKMAQGYAAKPKNPEDNPYYHDPELLQDIKNGLEYLYTFHYGPTVWEDGVFANWWHWDIGIPLKLTSILVILEDELGTELCKKYLEPFDYLNKYPSMTACNKVWIAKCVLLSAFLQRDIERILVSFDKMNDVFDYVLSGDGFYEDGSFIQHGKHSYTGGYGLSMINELTNLMYIFKGSYFQMQGDNVNNQYRWMFENFRPVMYAGNFMASMRGREVSRNTSEGSANNTAVASMIKMQAYAPDDIREELVALIRYYMLSSGKNYSSSVPINLIDYCIELFNSDIEPASNYYITKVFGMMDRVVHHGPEYGVCIALSSTRTYKYEAINRENMAGWYLGDGMIYIYTDGYDYNYNFFNYVDKYKMPGTTVSDATRIEQNLAGGILNSSPMAGGVEDGKYGIAMFDLGYAKNNYFNTSLVARKSYFMFDNEIVCVGSNITCKEYANVYTVVENRLWRNNDTLMLNGAAVSPSASMTEANAKYMHFSNMGGYVFLGNGSKVKYRKAANTNSFLEIVMEHGNLPDDAQYTYVYLPEASAEQTAQYQASPDVQIIKNTKYVHVVKETKLGITGYAFYDTGTKSGDEYEIYAKTTFAMMLSKGENGETILKISDPTHLLRNVEFDIKIPGATSVTSQNGKVISNIGSDGVINVRVNTVGASGKTFTVVIK